MSQPTIETAIRAGEEQGERDYWNGFEYTAVASSFLFAKGSTAARKAYRSAYARGWNAARASEGVTGAQMGENWPAVRIPA